MPEVENVSPSSYLGRVRDMEKMENLCGWLVQIKATNPKGAIFIQALVDRMVSGFGYARSSAYRELNRPGFVKVRGVAGIKVWFQADKVMPYAKEQGYEYYPEDPSVFLDDDEARRPLAPDYEVNPAARNGKLLVVPLITELALAATMSNAEYLTEIRQHLDQYNGAVEKQKAILRTTVSALATYYTMIEDGSYDGTFGQV